MFRLAVITLFIIMIFDFSLINGIAHYRDYVLGSLLALAVHPWVARQLD